MSERSQQRSIQNESIPENKDLFRPPLALRRKRIPKLPAGMARSPRSNRKVNTNDSIPSSPDSNNESTQAVLRRKRSRTKNTNVSAFAKAVHGRKRESVSPDPVLSDESVSIKLPARRTGRKTEAFSEALEKKGETSKRSLPLRKSSIKEQIEQDWDDDQPSKKHPRRLSKSLSRRDDGKREGSNGRSILLDHGSVDQSAASPNFSKSNIEVTEKSLAMSLGVRNSFASKGKINNEMSLMGSDESTSSESSNESVNIPLTWAPSEESSLQQKRLKEMSSSYSKLSADTPVKRLDKDRRKEKGRDFYQAFLDIDTVNGPECSNENDRTITNESQRYSTHQKSSYVDSINKNTSERYSTSHRASNAKVSMREDGSLDKTSSMERVKDPDGRRFHSSSSINLSRLKEREGNDLGRSYLNTSDESSDGEEESDANFESLQKSLKESRGERLDTQEVSSGTKREELHYEEATLLARRTPEGKTVQEDGTPRHYSMSQKNGHGEQSSENNSFQEEHARHDNLQQKSLGRVSRRESPRHGSIRGNNSSPRRVSRFEETSEHDNLSKENSESDLLSQSRRHTSRHQETRRRDSRIQESRNRVNRKQESVRHDSSSPESPRQDNPSHESLRHDSLKQKRPRRVSHFEERSGHDNLSKENSEYDLLSQSRSHTSRHQETRRRDSRIQQSRNRVNRKQESVRHDSSSPENPKHDNPSHESPRHDSLQQKSFKHRSSRQGSAQESFKDVSRRKSSTRFVSLPQDSPRGASHWQESTKRGTLPQGSLRHVSRQQKSSRHDSLSQESPRHGSPSQESPRHGSLSQENPRHDSPSQSPRHGSPSQESPRHGSLSQENPRHDSPSQESPRHGSPSQESPRHGSPSQESPRHGSPSQESPRHGSFLQGSPRRITSQQKSVSQLSVQHTSRRSKTPRQTTAGYSESDDSRASEEEKAPLQTRHSTVQNENYFGNHSNEENSNVQGERRPSDSENGPPSDGYVQRKSKKGHKISNASHDHRGFHQGSSEDNVLSSARRGKSKGTEDQKSSFNHMLSSNYKNTREALEELTLETAREGLFSQRTSGATKEGTKEIPAGQSNDRMTAGTSEKRQRQEKLVQESSGSSQENGGSEGSSDEVRNTTSGILGKHLPYLTSTPLIGKASQCLQQPNLSNIEHTDGERRFQASYIDRRVSRSGSGHQNMLSDARKSQISKENARLNEEEISPSKRGRHSKIIKQKRTIDSETEKPTESKTRHSSTRHTFDALSVNATTAKGTASREQSSSSHPSNDLPEDEQMSTVGAKSPNKTTQKNTGDNSTVPSVTKHVSAKNTPRATNKYSIPESPELVSGSFAKGISKHNLQENLNETSYEASRQKSKTFPVKQSSIRSFLVGSSGKVTKNDTESQGERPSTSGVSRVRKNVNTEEPVPSDEDDSSLEVGVFRRRPFTSRMAALKLRKKANSKESSSSGEDDPTPAAGPSQRNINLKLRKTTRKVIDKKTLLKPKTKRKYTLNSKWVRSVLMQNMHQTVSADLLEIAMDYSEKYMKTFIKQMEKNATKHKRERINTNDAIDLLVKKGMVSSHSDLCALVENNLPFEYECALRPHILPDSVGRRIERIVKKKKSSD